MYHWSWLALQRWRQRPGPFWVGSAESDSVTPSQFGGGGVGWCGRKERRRLESDNAMLSEFAGQACLPHQGVWKANQGAESDAESGCVEGCGGSPGFAERWEFFEGYVPKITNIMRAENSKWWWFINLRASSMIQIHFWHCRLSYKHCNLLSEIHHYLRSQGISRRAVRIFIGMKCEILATANPGLRTLDFLEL